MTVQTSDDAIHHCRDQIQYLRERNSVLAVTLREAASLLKHSGQFSLDVIDRMFEIRNDFDRLKEQVLLDGFPGFPNEEATQSLFDDLTSTSSAHEVLSLTDLEEVFESRILVQRSLSRLQRLAMIQHADRGDDGPWQRCLEDGRKLHEELLVAPPLKARVTAEQFLAPQAPLNAIFTLVSDGSNLPDDHWSVLIDTVSAAYGREVSTAIARGKLFLTSDDN